jgi:hypothetical protein
MKVSNESGPFEGLILRTSYLLQSLDQSGLLVYFYKLDYESKRQLGHLACLVYNLSNKLHVHPLRRKYSSIFEHIQKTFRYFWRIFREYVCKVYPIEHVRPSASIYNIQTPSSGS